MSEVESPVETMANRKTSDSNEKLQLSVKKADSAFGIGAFEVKVVGAPANSSTVVLTSPRSFAFKKAVSGN
ncbi:hypothetical protein [Roseibium alexandrii]|uniref:Uncharacterized protein n=1 Tax=Roseibium alexandrii (strain DSM 17067 / NCIMB 14079 / DFL-11) TaxID=244592 RepID=A0A5E8GYM5_ROSAD|nr:hypothetical protein [Roseibium alexandrii]EEE45227.1 hypothetical protein SADFL11_2516 [Roseibium alexandrii DFL-11]